MSRKSWALIVSVSRRLSGDFASISAATCSNRSPERIGMRTCGSTNVRSAVVRSSGVMVWETVNSTNIWRL